jgi:hypothetical protein
LRFENPLLSFFTVRRQEFFFYYFLGDGNFFPTLNVGVGEVRVEESEVVIEANEEADGEAADERGHVNDPQRSEVEVAARIVHLKFELSMAEKSEQKASGEACAYSDGRGDGASPVYDPLRIHYQEAARTASDVKCIV